MKDFSQYRSTGYVIPPSEWAAYRAWVATRVCRCGKRASERTAADPWATEEECMQCWTDFWENFDQTPGFHYETPVNPNEHPSSQ